MKITRCSASSIGLYKHCAFAYFMHYILGLESKAGKAALQGTIVHQVFDWMTKLKKRGKTNVPPMWLLNRAWDELTTASPEIEIRKVTTRIDKETGKLKEAADFKKCRIAVEKVLADPHYNPYETNVLMSEQWFEIPMHGEEWSCVDNDGNSKQFTVRGFIDLVNKIDNTTIEIVDWKTGARKNFYTQDLIDESTLTREAQARIYHLAAYIKYPMYENILVTFYYTNDGGPVTVAFSHDDLPATIASLYRLMKTVQKDTLLLRNRHWKCRMCHFQKNDLCQRVWSDIHTMGSEYVKNKYVDTKDEEVLNECEMI